MDFGSALLSLLSAVIGGAVVSGVNSWLTWWKESRTRRIEEKKAVYYGLWDAIHENEAAPSPRNATAVGTWHNKISLMGSPQVVYWSQKNIDTEPMTPERRIALDNLIKAMRKDLNVDKRKLT